MKQVFTIVILLLVSVLGYTGLSHQAGAVGNGSEAACDSASHADTNPNDTGSTTPFTFNFDAGAGNIVTGVCIKSGNNMFGDSHSGMLGNGSYESGCYTVSGVGTQFLTVTRNLSGDTCQDISHLDIDVDTNITGTVAPTDSVTPTETLTPTPTDEITVTPTDEVTVTPTDVPDFTPTPTTSSGSPTPTNPCVGASCNTGGGGNTPTPTPSTGPTATLSPTLAVTATITSTSAPSPTPPSKPAGGVSSVASPTQAPSASSPAELVLGAKAMASTGEFERNLMNIFAIFGMLLLGAGYMSYAKDQRSKK